MKQRNPRKSLPLEEKSYCGGWLRYVVPPADFALIRRFAPPSPPGGRLLRRFLVVRDSADFCVRLRSRTKPIRTAEGSLPPGGEGGAPATDEGEIGEWNHVTQPSRRSSLPLRGGRWREATDEGEIGERDHLCLSSVEISKKTFSKVFLAGFGAAP